MGSASREALVAARSALSELLGTTVGSELLSAAAAIHKSSALENALSDASLPGSAKAEIVGRVFGGLTDGARSVLTAAVAQNWSAGSEFVDGVEELGIRALSISDASFVDELLAAKSVIDSSHELELELGNKLGDPVAKVALAAKIFEGKLSRAAFDAVTHLIANPRGRRVRAALQEAARTAADQAGCELATVSVAAPMSEAQQQKLASLLEKSVGRAVKVTTVVDPTLIGGVRIQIADDVIDGSVQARLEDLRQRLAA